MRTWQEAIDECGHLLRREVGRLDFGKAREWIAHVDGAPWVRELMQLHLAELDGLGLEFYHLSENVRRARRVVFGKEAAEGKAWACPAPSGFHEARWNDRS